MLRAAPAGHPLQKRTVVQWDIGAVLKADGAADESVSPQSGISHCPSPRSPAQLGDFQVPRLSTSKAALHFMNELQPVKTKYSLQFR
jgi:hypothetical protein